MAEFAGKDGFLYLAAAVNISDANYSTGVVTVDTAAAHGLTAGCLVQIASVVGMTDLNTVHIVLGVTDADTFTVTLTTAQSYTSGGTSRHCYYITDWGATIEAETLDVTDSSSGTDSEFIPAGFTTASGSLSGFVKDGSDCPVTGTTYVGQLNYDSTNYWAGSFILTNMTASLQVKGGEAVKKTFSFQGTGAWAETNA